MPGAHTHIYSTVQLNLTNSTLNHGPGSWTLQEKGRKVKNEPAHGPPLQARVVAASGTVLTTNLRRSWRTWNEQGGGQSKMNGGKNVEEGSGHGMAKASRHTQPAEQGRCRRTQPADDPTGTGLKAQLQTIRPIQASQQNNSHRCRPASRRAVQVGGGSAVVLATQEAGSDLPTCLPPTYRLCLSLHIPPPLICKNPI